MSVDRGRRVGGPFELRPLKPDACIRQRRAVGKGARVDDTVQVYRRH